MRKFLILLVLALVQLGCGGDPISSLFSSTPSPSPALPSPSPDARLSCTEDNLKLVVTNGAGNPDFLFDFREIVTAQASPRNSADAPLPESCAFSRVVGWSGSGPGIQQLGDVTGFVSLWKFQEPGNFSIIATHDRFKAIWNGVLIRNVSDGVIYMGRDKFGDPLVSVTVYRDGAVIHVYRLISGDWRDVR